MGRIKSHVVSFLLLLLSIVIVPINVEAASVKLNKTKETLYVGQTTTLKVKGTKNKVKWSSSNKKVATVNSKGKVTAKKKGTAKITAKIGNKKLTCKITVKKTCLNKSEVSLEKGSTIKLKLYGCKAKKWSSTNKKVATVNKNGKVSAINTGTATIKVKANNNKTYSCKITVIQTKQTSKNQSEQKPDTTHTHCYVCTVTKEANCQENGLITYNCSCGESYTESTPKTNHSFGNTVNTKTTTCTEDGINSITCTICGLVETTTIKASGHNMVNGVCTACGYTENHSHNYVQSDMIDSTCKEPGKITYTCICGDFYTEEIPIKAHNYEISNLKPTCEEKGYTLHTCSNCGYSYKNNYVNATGHSWDEGNTILVAKCSEYGLVQYHCTVCRKFKDVNIPKLEHQVSEEWIIEEYCGEIGRKYQVCSLCKNEVNKQKLPPTGKHQYLSDGYCKNCDYYSEENHQHSYDETIIKETTCSESGEKLYTCACGDSYRAEITKLNHTQTDWIIDTEATCEESGSKHIECSVCKEVIETKEIKSLGHNYELVNTVSSTCATNGYKEYVCSECGDSYKEDLPLKKHSYGHFVEKVKPADFETFGTADMVCPECNETLFADLTAVLIDLGNGESTTIYGYYNYEEAYKNFELTLEYKKTHTDKDGELLYNESFGFEWDEEMYHLSCIRAAESVYIHQKYKNTDQWENDIDLHTRPNNDDVPGSENALVRWESDASIALQLWLDSPGHKYIIEQQCWNRISVSVFKAWISDTKCFNDYWIQNYARVN